MSGSAGRPRLAGRLASVPTASSLSRRMVGDQHGLDGRSAGGVGFGLVQLAERVAGDELVEREPALLPQVDEPRDEQLGYGVALEDAYEVAAAAQRKGVQDQVALGDADESARAGGAHAVDGGGDDSGYAGGIEAVLGAVAGDGEDLGRDVVVGAVDGVGGAQL